MLPAPDPTLVALASLLAVAAVAKHAHLEAVARDHAFTRVGLVPGPARARLAVLCACATAGALLPSPLRPLSLALLALCSLLAIDARHDRTAAPGERWIRVRPLDRARARREAVRAWLGAGSWLDATTPFGVALLLSIYVLAWLAQGVAGEVAGDLAWLTTPLFLTGTRLHRPEPLHATLARLDHASANLPDDERARGELLVLIDARGHAVDARWRLSWSHSLAGLEHLDLVLIDTRWLDRTRRMTAWLAGAIARSPAAEALESALPRARRYLQDDRVAYLVTTATPEAEIASLRAWLAPALDDRLPHAA